MLLAVVKLVVFNWPLGFMLGLDKHQVINTSFML
jgi:hypothetical protein